MRFLFLSLGYHPDQIGGAYRYVTEVAERLATRGHEVHVVFPRARPELPETEQHSGVHLHRYPDAKGFFYANWRKENAAAADRVRLICSISKEPTITVLAHAFLEPAARAAAPFWLSLFTGPWAQEYLLARQAQPRSLAQRGFDRWIASWLQSTEQRALAGAQSILTISRYYKQQLPLWHGTSLPCIRMISGGVDTERFRPLPDREKLRTSYGLASSDILLLAVRRLDPRMGLTTLIESFAQIAEAFPHARLWLAGQGAQREELERQASATGLGERIRFLGYVPEDELPKLFNAADVTLMPSLDLEGFGLATVESLACGTPVIGSQSGATPELLEPLGLCTLFPPGDSKALGVVLRRVLLQPETLPTREDCREYAVTRFNWDRVVEQFEQAGHKVLAKGVA